MAKKAYQVYPVTFSSLALARVLIGMMLAEMDYIETSPAK